MRNQRFLAIYRVPFLISLTLSIVLIAVSLARDPWSIVLIILGALLGTFFLDLEYLIYAFFLEPKEDFSKTLAGFIKDRDYPNAAQYIEINKDKVKDKTLNSALFQVVMAFFALFVVSSNRQFFIRALVVSILANSIYRFFEAKYKGQLNEWFWALKESPSSQGVNLYTIFIILVLLICIYIF
jgi:hypothetical protein